MALTSLQQEPTRNRREAAPPLVRAWTGECIGVRSVPQCQPRLSVPRTVVATEVSCITEVSTRPPPPQPESCATTDAGRSECAYPTRPCRVAYPARPHADCACETTSAARSIRERTRAFCLFVVCLDSCCKCAHRQELDAGKLVVLFQQLAEACVRQVNFSGRSGRVMVMNNRSTNDRNKAL